MLRTLSLATVDTAPSPGDVLCRVDDISDITEGGAKSFRFGTGPFEVRIFLLRSHDKVYAYLNVCPHVLTALDWVPDRFLDVTRSYIQCATHGAQFRIKDGFCISGPCAGKRLTAIPIVVADGEVRVGP